MFKLLAIVALAGLVAACSTFSGNAGVSTAAAMGARGAPSQMGIGPQGNGP